jgi:hypothetical protein
VAQGPEGGCSVKIRLIHRTSASLLYAGVLLVSLGSPASGVPELARPIYPSALGILRSGDLVVLDSAGGVSHGLPGRSGGLFTEIPFRISGQRASDVAVTTNGPTDTIYLALTSTSAGPWPTHVVALNLDGSLGGDWRIPLGTTRISGLAVDAAAGTAYVADAGAPRILSVQVLGKAPADSVRVIATIPGAGTGPLSAVALDLKRHRLLVADLGGGIVWGVPLPQGTPTPVAKDLGAPSALLVDPRLDRLYVADGDGRRVVAVGLAAAVPNQRLQINLAGAERPSGLALADHGIWISDRTGVLQLVSSEGRALQRIEHLSALARPATELSAEARQNLDWCRRDSGPADCVSDYLAQGQSHCILGGGGRSCLMRAASELAAKGDCGQAFMLTLLCQCHNPQARYTLETAGPEAICRYLKSTGP